MQVFRIPLDLYSGENCGRDQGWYANASVISHIHIWFWQDHCRNVVQNIFSTVFFAWFEYTHEEIVALAYNVLFICKSHSSSVDWNIECGEYYYAISY